ncbi:ribosome maturation factor RimP [Desulfocurvibacter africanus]|uniref:Ribosome maturation factor RimP n=1 Tax=Desulfocurvibacter africanus subsp. africanus str. Walvis Bay TaxID=690850 RepID=F3YZY9_DESAF|nr:ribosome maturation factor RimP [Desulfocurvibacter africanus]EGJ52018.1 Ribosome maturation factor rimP [Desulfocurvibacter africanus subsp. africanus str. Walvis Bay]
MAVTTEITNRIAQAARTVIEPMGLSLWGVEIVLDGRGQTVLVYVESPTGVSVEQLAEASRNIGLVLDVEDFIPGTYRLELSSPGFERSFFSTEQMRDYMGEKVEIRTSVPLGDRRKFRGILKEVREDSIAVEAEGQLFNLRWEDVKKARLIVEDPWKHADKKKTQGKSKA